LNGPQRTILFLIADTGAGHRSAANAIRNAIIFIAQKKQEEWLIQQQTGTEEQKSMPSQAGYRIEIVDVFEEYSHFPLREAVKLSGRRYAIGRNSMGVFFISVIRFKDFRL
jgi:1,2-diacylglycerol 3-beta-galactosyltransferase